MKNMSGLILSEIVTYILFVIIGAAVIFGIYVSSQRDAVVESAEASLKEVKAAIETAEKNGMPIDCSNELVTAEVLNNDYLSLNIKPMPFDINEINQGYGVGVFVRSSKEADGNDSFITAERLQKVLSKEDDEDSEAEYFVRLSMESEEEIAYGILVHESAQCANVLAKQ